MLSDIYFKEDEQGKRYPYINVGSEDYGRPSFRLWVSGRFLQQQDDGYYIKFPLKGAKIERTQKGSLVLRPNNEYITYDVFVSCGFRGGSKLEILSPSETETFKYYFYSSPRGSTGISTGALVNTPSREVLKYRWEKTGRLYGKSSKGITIITPDGEVKEFEDLPDGLESLEELPTEKD